jgi:predicted NAD-dependent protein-ADP-ribosyltransferase YbiA (DUF1768 family)
VTRPLIIAYFDGDSEVRCLSNFAKTPFELDGRKYHTVEAFWQMLKIEDEICRDKIRLLESGMDAKQAGMMMRGISSQLFTYEGQLYQVGSEAHHQLLERAIRAKVGQNPEVQRALIDSGDKPLKHMLKNRFGQWRPGNSPALPAIVFENMLVVIRKELQEMRFQENLRLPEGVDTKV